MRRFFIGFIVVAIGVMMVVQKAGFYDFSWFMDQEWKKYIIPVVVILIGIRMMFSRTHKGCSVETDGFEEIALNDLKEGEIVNASVAFSGSRYNLNDQMFYGAKLDAFCGGISLDLSGTEIADKCVIDIHTLMGGVEIKAPSNVKFSISSNCILGGVNNKNYRGSDNATKTIFLKANCLIGGVDIKN